MFERFTADARGVVLGAVQAAGELGSPQVGTEHLLLALAGDGGPAGQVLRGAGATADLLRAELVGRRGPVDGEPVLDPDALASIGIDMAEVRRAVEETFGPGALSSVPARGRRRWWGRSAERLGHKRFTPESKAVLERALREALALRDRYVGSEHVLLGLIGPAGSPPVSAATAVLTARATDLAALRAPAVAGRERRAG